MKKYYVKEIFGPTIQGEGTHAGSAVMFLRFAGCNRWNGKKEDQANAVCWFCDTDFFGGEPLTATEIVERLKALSSVQTVVLSGGEATLQIDEPLLKELTDADFLLHLETNGSRDIGEKWRFFDHITMSPKQPPSETKLKWCNDLKVLYPSPIPGVTPEAFEGFDTFDRFIQPIDGPNLEKNTQSAVNFCLSNSKWRISVQLHKLLGVK